MNVILSKCINKVVLFGIFCFCAHVAYGADAQNNQAEVRFHGTLKHFPCHVNNDRLIEVHFGNVAVNKVDGQNYEKKIDYSIRCDGEDTVDNLMLSVNGAASVFDDSVLQTTVMDLGIKIYQNGQMLRINEPLEIDPQNPPELTAIPVQKNGAVLTAQDFKVTATLLVNYQ